MGVVDSFVLPGVSFSAAGFRGEACVVVTGGRAPAAEWLSAVARGRTVLAADHGMDACRAAGVVPAELLGDFDSVDAASLAFAREAGVRVSAYPREKDDTDTQLVLRLAAERGYRTVLLTGGFGSRFDHALSTASAAAESPSRIIVADEREVLLFLKDGDAVAVTCEKKPLAISLLPFFGDAEGVRATGLHWPLRGARLSVQHQMAVSNVLEDGTRFCVAIERGVLGVYLCYAE